MSKFTRQKNKVCPQRFKHSFSRRGFTLIETLVAISVFTMSILTLIIILSQGITSTFYAKQKMTAGYLAQEGIEYARNMRDSYVISSATSQEGWDAFKTKMTACGAPNGCYLNDSALFTGSLITDLSYTPCPSNCPQLSYNLGKYGYTGSLSGFVHKIQATTISVNEIKVSSSISWSQGSGNFNITFSENLFNWAD